jgi:hypothetical protein
MKTRLAIALVIGGMLGTAFGFALGIFVYPFWFLTDVAAETVTDAATRTTLASGRFVHANPSDPVHWGKGGVRILDGRDGGGRVVHLRSDFEVGPGPRFHVYLADRRDIRSNADFRAAVTLDLGRLRAFRGSQVYPVPAGVDLARIGSVVIWCKEFGVLISPATLDRAG